MTTSAPDLIGVAHRVQRWSHDRRDLVDLLFAMLIAGATLAEIASVSALAGARAADPFAVVLVVIGATALIWRRRAPISSLAVVTAVLCIFWASGYHWFLSVLGLPAIYSVAVHTDDRRRAWTAIGLAYSALIVIASFTILNPDDGYAFGNATSMALYLGAAAVVGAVIRNRQQIFVDTQQRADQAEANRLVEAERAVARERNRIAREMHDVVAHGMSVISVQAAAAQEIVRSNPDRTVHVLENIEAAGRQSLAEMRRMLAVLRSGDTGTTAGSEPTPLSPQPSLNDLDTIVAHCIEAGTPTELVVVGRDQPLPPGVELAAFRIVQEALTNVLKHAGDRASATVELRYLPGALQLTVTDTGKGAVSTLSHSGGSNGLIGMRERVDVYDGDISAGPKPGGGYRVRAVLRHDADDTGPTIGRANSSGQQRPAPIDHHSPK